MGSGANVLFEWCCTCPLDKQCVMFLGKQLKDGRTSADCNIHKMATQHWVLLLRHVKRNILELEDEWWSFGTENVIIELALCRGVCPLQCQDYNYTCVQG